MKHIYTFFILISLTGLIFAQEHLLLTEFVATPTAGEFIELVNPTSNTIDLTNYYLSDDEDYALLPGQFGNGPAPGIGDFDFIAKFPDGASIAQFSTIVIAFNDTGFVSTYTLTADYELLGTGSLTDMVEPFTDAIGASAGLTNSGENVVLFYWDGSADLVMDVDMANVGTPSSSNDIGDKTGLMVDGPDADTLASTYLNDGVTMPQQTADPGFGFSTKRIGFEDGNEIQSGGNGITGHDETTEDITVTWDSDPFSAPTPGIVDFTIPVELTSFSAVFADGKINLHWSTATELNNYGFEIHRSANKSYWNTIGFVKGNGTISTPIDYSFVDTELENADVFYYRLKQIDHDGSAEFSNTIEVVISKPDKYILAQNYPNPFNPSTVIEFKIAEPGFTKLTLYNSLGQVVETLVNKNLEAGIHSVNFNAKNLTSGIYYYRIGSGSFVKINKMMLLK